MFDLRARREGAERSDRRDEPSPMGAQLYAAVPAGLVALDEPTPDDQGQGQLRRFLDVLGRPLDDALDGVAELRALRDLDRMPEVWLARTAELLGWPLGPDGLRVRLRESAELYRRLGTEAGLVALLRRATGMDVSLRVYADRVAYTNAPEPLTRWDLVYRRRSPKKGFAAVTLAAAKVEASREFQGRAAIAWSGDDPIVVGHRLVAGRTDLWAFTAGAEPTPWPGRSDAVERCNPALAVWDHRPVLAWEEVGPGSPPSIVVSDGARRVELGPGRWPALATRANGGVLAAWVGEENGRSRLMMRPITAAFQPGLASHDLPDAIAPEAPALACDEANRPWLAWASADPARPGIQVGRFNGASFVPAPPPPAIAGCARVRDPALAWHDGEMHLCWAAAHGELWRIWTASCDGQRWTDPRALTDPGGEREPAIAASPSGALQVVWRSRRIAEQQDRTLTLDLSDRARVARLGGADDAVHYTAGGRYTSSCLGIELRPPPGAPTPDAATLRRLERLVAPLVPAHLRLVWITPIQAPDLNITLSLDGLVRLDELR